MRERILANATDLFIERGYADVAMREIAASCQITKAALYYHFVNKEDLLAAVFSSALDDYADIVASVGHVDRGREKLQRLVAAFLRLPVRQRAILRLVQHDLGQLGAERRTTFTADYHQRFIEPLTRIFTDATQTGEFRAIDPQTGTWLLLGMMQPFLVSPITTDPNLAATLSDVFCDGIVAAQPSS